MEAVYLKVRGLPHKDICRFSRTSENTLRAYLRQFQQGGVERLKRLDFAVPTSELADHRQALEDAAHFAHGPSLGYLWSFVRLLIRGPPGRKRFNVLGAFDAVTNELTTVCNKTTIIAEAIDELLGRFSARHVGGGDQVADDAPVPDLQEASNPGRVQYR